MAANFGTSGRRVTAGTDPLPSVGAMSFWLNPTWLQTDGQYHVAYLHWDGIFPSGNFFTFQKFTDSAMNIGWYSAGVDYRRNIASANYSQAANDWNHWLYQWGPSGQTTWLNKSIIDTTTDVPVTHSVSATRWIGNRETTTNGIVGSMAEFGIFNRELTTLEREALFQGVSPLVLDAVNHYGFTQELGFIDTVSGAALTTPDAPTLTTHIPTLYPFGVDQR